MRFYTKEAFENIACHQVFVRPNGYKQRFFVISEKRKWASFFGTSSTVTNEIWTRIDPVANVDPHARPCHLLWALVLLKNYAGDKMHAKTVDCCKKSFAHWAWIFIEQVFLLHEHVVSLVFACLRMVVLVARV
jgi:hypothetical protein